MPEITFHHGRLPNDPTKARIWLGRFLDFAELNAQIAPPVKVDWGSGVTDWGMYLNDSLGDCTCADLGHTIKQTSLYGTKVEISVTDADVLKTYKAVSGYDGTPATDNGAVIQDVMSYWRKTGIGGHKSLAFAEVDITNLDEVYAAIEVFGSVHLGLNFPAFAMDQFNNGQPWDVQTTNAKIEGGHDVVGVGYDKAQGTITVVTWGALQTVTLAFFKKYFEEGWIAILPEWVNVQGVNPEGIDLYGLGQQLHILTGDPNPFPAPAPVPDPVPTPIPTPPPAPTPVPVSGSDALLWSQTKVWASQRHVSGNKAAAAAVNAWAKAKGLV
jgi:hypothetical protein